MYDVCTYVSIYASVFRSEVNYKCLPMAANFWLKLSSGLKSAKNGQKGEILKGILFLSCGMAIYNRECGSRLIAKGGRTIWALDMLGDWQK